jgi:hypothetical protein
MARNVSRTWVDSRDHRRKIADAINGVMDGRTNNAGTVTLTSSAVSTQVSDNRVGTDSVIVFMPTTANAAAEIGAGTMYISARGKQTFTITHASNGQTDRDFTYAVLATSYTDA